MLASAPDRRDQDARALRERLEFAVLGDDDRACAEAARALVAFCADHPEYRLCTLIPESAPVTTESDAKRIVSKYAGRCTGCGKPYAEGATVFWTPGKKGALCLGCGGKA